LAIIAYLWARGCFGDIVGDYVCSFRMLGATANRRHIMVTFFYYYSLEDTMKKTLDTLGIEPNTSRIHKLVLSGRDKPTTPCAR
jgi:hypothetical protein